MAGLYKIVPSQEAHVQTIIEIFNFYVRESYAAFFSHPLPYRAVEQLSALSDGYPRLTALDAGGAVVGFGFLRPFHPADTLKRTADIVYFIDTVHTRRGAGTLLLQGLVDAAKPLGIRNIIATISTVNEESIAFHRKHNFQECGRIPKAGVKFGREYDIVQMLRTI